MKKSILLIGPVSDALGGQGVAGIARHVEGLASQLKVNGFKVTIWYHRQNKSLSINDEIKIIGDNYYTKIARTLKGLFLLSFKGGFAQRGLPFFRVLIMAHQYAVLSKILKTNLFDVVHVHSLNSFVGNSLEILKKGGVKLPKIIFTDHGFWQNPDLTNNPDNPYFKNIKCNVKLAHKVIFISDYAKQQLANFGLHQEKFHKIQNPMLSVTTDKKRVETLPNFIKSFIKKNNGKTIIFFNGFTETLSIKKLDLLLDAIESDNCLKKRVSLVAACNDKAKTYISSKKWSFDILALGKQPTSVIHYLYDACSCLVNPSISESYGLVYIEALQHGKPIIGFYRVIEEFRKNLGVDIGFGFDAINDTKESLASLIIQLIDKEWDKELLIERANELTWDKKISEFISLYES